jgi:hypothetical protein
MLQDESKDRKLDVLESTEMVRAQKAPPFFNERIDFTEIVPTLRL